MHEDSTVILSYSSYKKLVGVGGQFALLGLISVCESFTIPISLL